MPRMISVLAFAAATTACTSSMNPIPDGSRDDGSAAIDVRDVSVDESNADNVSPLDAERDVSSSETGPDAGLDVATTDVGTDAPSITDVGRDALIINDAHGDTSSTTDAFTDGMHAGCTWTGPWRSTAYSVPTSFTRVITTPTAFRDLVAATGALTVGDVVHVVGPMTLDGCAGCHTLILKKLAAPGASIYFDDNVVFAGDTSTRGYSAVYVDATNVRLYGGVVAGGQGGGGVIIGPGFSSDTVEVTNITWWGVKIHDVGGGGLYVGGERNSSGTWLGVSNVDFDAEIWAVGQQPQNDPHTVKGTGIHAIYVGGSPIDPVPGWSVRDSRFSIYTHDTSQCAGDAQIGQSVLNSEFWVRAYRLSFVGTAAWAASYAIGLWTATINSYVNRDITVHDVEACNTTGPTVSTGSLGSGPVTVQYGRATHVLTNAAASSSYGGHAFVPSSHVTYVDVAQFP